jgi:hypothetical protein
MRAMFRSVITVVMLTTAITHAFVGCSTGLHCLLCHGDDVEVAVVQHLSGGHEPATAAARLHKKDVHQHGCSHGHSHGPSDSPQEHSNAPHENDSHGHPGDHCSFVSKLPGVDGGLRWQEQLDRDHLAEVMQPSHATSDSSASALVARTSTPLPDATMFRALGVLLL